MVKKASKNDKINERISKAISDLDNKEFTMYFFIADSRNIPNPHMQYIYQMALETHNKGYRVCMLYQLDNEYTKEELDELNKDNQFVDQSRVFIGVKEWLGEEYGVLEHLNISLGTWSVGPSDFLFIPEAFSSMMFQTYKHNVPCKRFVIVQNEDYVTDMIPLGIEWGDYGIMDAICSTEFQKTNITRYFPYLRTKVLEPYIPGYFKKPVKPKKLIVNILAKDQKYVNKIVKSFYWQYPIYKFIAFRDLRNFPKHMFADLLKEGAITVWVDRETKFGNSCLEALKCGNIVIGQIPDKEQKWMVSEDGGLRDNCVWFNDIEDVPKLLANVVNSWINDKIPEAIEVELKYADEIYTYESWQKEIDCLLNTLVEERKNELEDIKNIKIKKTEE